MSVQCFISSLGISRLQAASTVLPLSPWDHQSQCIHMMCVRPSTYLDVGLINVTYLHQGCQLHHLGCCGISPSACRSCIRANTHSGLLFIHLTSESCLRGDTLLCHQRVAWVQSSSRCGLRAWPDVRPCSQLWSCLCPFMPGVSRIPCPIGQGPQDSGLPLPGLGIFLPIAHSSYSLTLWISQAGS